MSKRNQIQEANKFLTGLLDKFPHYIVYAFKHKGEEFEVEELTTFDDEYLAQIKQMLAGDEQEEQN